MTTFIQEALRLAREFRKQFAKTKKPPRRQPISLQRVKALWLLVRTAGRHSETPPPCGDTHYAYTPDLRKLQQNKFRIIAGSNAPPAVVSSTRKNQNIKNSKHFI